MSRARNMPASSQSVDRAATQVALVFGAAVLIAAVESILLFLYPKSRLVRICSQVSLGLFFILAGWNHFKAPKLYVNLMPWFLPLHLELVYLSGVIEITFGALMLYPRTANVGAWGIFFTLLAVWPANWNHLLSSQVQRKVGTGVLFPLIRLPLQAVFFVWAYLLTEVPLQQTLHNLGL